MTLTCPHCRCPVDVLATAANEEILCPSCGSTFRLETERTLSWQSLKGRRLGRFELEKSVGFGAFGAVYCARDTQLDRHVAIKIPRPGHLDDREDLDRFLREGRSAARLRHPAIVPVYEVGVADGVPYIVSEFIEGPTLSDVLTARPLAPREVAELLATLAEALQYAHEQGVIHRDIKPSNILFDTAGKPHLVDFGLSRREAGEVTLTQDGQVLGTPAYMSPEQARGQAHGVDGRSDVYSLGVILYRLLTGELPFRGNDRMLLHQVLNNEPRSPRSFNDRIPRDLETICLKAMAKEPARRYAHARGLADDLRRYLEGKPILARRIGPLGVSWRWCKRRPALAASLAALAVTWMGALIGMTYLWSVVRDERDRTARNLDRMVDGLDRWYTKFSARPEIMRDDLRPLREEFLRTALAELKSLEREVRSNSPTSVTPRLPREHSLAAVRVSSMLTDLGQKDEALALIRSAIEEAEQFLRAEPQSRERKEILFLALHEGLRKEPEFARAAAMFRRADELFRSLSRGVTARDDPNHIVKQLFNIYNFALHNQGGGRRREATALLRRACALGEDLLAASGPDPDTMQGLAAAYSHLCDHEAGQNRLREAEHALRRAHALLKRRSDALGLSVRSLSDYGTACHQLQGYLTDWRRRDEATAVAEEFSRTLEVALALKRPDYERFTIGRMLVGSRYALMLAHRENYAAAEKAAPERASRELVMMEKACRETHEPADGFRLFLASDADLDYLNAIGCYNLCQILRERPGQIEEASRLYQRACDLMRASLEKQPNEERREELQRMLREAG